MHSKKGVLINNGRVRVYSNTGRKLDNGKLHLYSNIDEDSRIKKNVARVFFAEDGEVRL